ncbi:hypothetical protein EDB86DRAFT_3126204 [Lactarius hatsudake]|nr:hypothetical protein EDB86DRAFT_3126204 [Lactarius hatsudake]
MVDNGWIRAQGLRRPYIIYSIGLYIVDSPEQSLLACTVGGWCPRIVGYVMPFTSEFPRADIYELVAPDILHQVIKGTFKDHLVTWVGEYLDLTYGKTYAKMILDDIDRRIALAPPFPGLRRFPQGRGFKQWTGDDSKALMKVYLPALEGHLPADAIGVRPNGFTLPQQHSLCHYRHLICLFGAPNGLCSSITESKHIKAVKEPWRRSNRCNALGQMLVINQHLDKLTASRSYFESKGMIKSTVLADACEHAGLFGSDITDMPAGTLDTNPASRSANTDQGDNEGNLHHGAESTDPHEMDETHPVDDKETVSHVFLPESRRIERLSVVRHRAGRHLSPTRSSNSYPLFSV